MTRCARWLLPLLLPALLVSIAHAQGGRNSRPVVSPEVGIQVGRQFKDDEWIAGGYFRMPIFGAIDLRPSGDIALGGDHNYQLNGDIALHGARDLAYLGAGAAWFHRDFGGGKETRTGFNLFIGFKPIPRPGTQIYVEGRWTRVEGISFFRVSLGAAWRL
jgi:hypothetical protein